MQLVLLIVDFLQGESHAFRGHLQQQESLNLSENETQNDREWRRDKKF